MQTNPVEIPEANPFQNDLLERTTFIKNLKDVLTGGDKGIILGLNGAWGTGKTTAVNFLRQDLINEGHVVIVLNAWADDFVSDPLVAIIASLIEDSNFKTLITDTELVSRLIDIGKNVIGLAATLGISRLSMGTISGGEISSVLDIKTDYSEILTQYTEEKKSLAELRKILVQVSTILRDNDNKKLIIIVDELDRCKPTYAVALFERIKHILEIDNLRVLLSFDQQQLEATIQKHYGSKIDSNRYLEKMFDLIVNLPDVDLRKLLEKTVANLNIPTALPNRMTLGQNDHIGELIGMLSNLMNATNASARELERTLTRIKFLLGRQNGLNVDPVFAVVLLILKNQNTKLFNMIKLENSTFDDIDKVFKSIPSKARYWVGSYSNYIETLYYIKQDVKLDKVDLTSIAIDSQAFQELSDELKLKRQRMQAYINTIRDDRFGSLSEMATSVEFVIR